MVQISSNTIALLFETYHGILLFWSHKFADNIISDRIQFKSMLIKFVVFIVNACLWMKIPKNENVKFKSHLCGVFYDERPQSRDMSFCNLISLSLFLSIKLFIVPNYNVALYKITVRIDMFHLLLLFWVWIRAWQLKCEYWKHKFCKHKFCKPTFLSKDKFCKRKFCKRKCCTLKMTLGNSNK